MAESDSERDDTRTASMNSISWKTISWKSASRANNNSNNNNKPPTRPPKATKAKSARQLRTKKRPSLLVQNHSSRCATINSSRSFHAAANKSSRSFRALPSSSRAIAARDSTGKTNAEGPVRRLSRGVSSLFNPRLSNATQTNSSSPKKRPERNIRTGRILLASTVLVLAILLGLGSYYCMHVAERRVSRVRFRSIARHTATLARRVLLLEQQQPPIEQKAFEEIPLFFKYAFEPDVTGIRFVLSTRAMQTVQRDTFEVIRGVVSYAGNLTHRNCLVENYPDYVSNECDDTTSNNEEDSVLPRKKPWMPFEDLDYYQQEEGDFRSLEIPLPTTGMNQHDTYYSLDIYATEEFVSRYGSLLTGENCAIGASLAVCLGVVGAMVLTSLVFVVYEYYVEKDLDAKNNLLEAKRRFVRFVSHEVRTPLNTVCMGLTLLENDLAKAMDDRRKNERRSKFLVLKKESVEEWMSLSKQVFQNAETAVGVLSDLLNYDKIQMGSLTLELRLLNLWTALEKTVQEFQMAAAEKGVTLTIDFSPLVEAAAVLTYESFTEDDSLEDEPSGSMNGRLAVEMGNGLGMVRQGSSRSSGMMIRQESVRSSASSRMTSPKPLKAFDLPEKIKNCKVVGDKIRLTQVFRNLISNGLKFSKKRTKMTVRVSMDPLPERKQREERVSLHKGIVAEVINVGTVSIDVIDEGVGMTPEQVDTVFDDGTQFNANKLQAGGGSGLGLNIARGIVLEHGGSLTCSSEGIGKGATFTLSTTLYMDDDVSNSAMKSSELFRRSSSQALLRTSSQTFLRRSASTHLRLSSSQMSEDTDEEAGEVEFCVPPLHVLVVDDSLSNRKLCQRLLERNGHTTEGASNGQEAVELVRESLISGKLYDSILLDYQMPIMNGPDACRQIREMGCASYIAGVTGNVMSEDVDHFRNCGANWVLPKPFSLKALEDQWVEDGVGLGKPFVPNDSGAIEVDVSEDLSESFRGNQY